jgi:glycosyltransferase involved in cell wall biosynthesis
MNEWVADKVVDYLGFTDQVKTVMENANCLVLPSYREGLSKALIEGSSMSLPIITSDTPGCKDVIVDHETGFLCQIKDSNDLFLKMEKILRLSPDQLVKMGNAGRMRAESLFDVKDVISAYKSAIMST